MADETTNYALVKPLTSEYYDISVPNGNMDKIDAAIKAVTDAQADFVPKSRTINGKSLSSDITLAPEDVGAVSGTLLPSISQSIEASRRNTINILRLKLQQSLSASDIDAWSDTLNDALRIDEARSLNYSLLLDYCVKVQRIEQPNQSSSVHFGGTEYLKVAQLFNTAIHGAFSLHQITVKLSKRGSPTDKLTMYIHATNANTPGAQLLQSTNTIEGTSLTGDLTDCTFEFPSIDLSPYTTYAFSLSRSGTYDEYNCYNVGVGPNGTDMQGTGCAYNGSSWNNNTFYLYFAMNYGTASVVWNPVAATEPLRYAAICADQTENSGTITWYMSDNGTSWVEVPDLDTIQEVNFQSPSVYLKCELTEDATVQDVAWGGY